MSHITTLLLLVCFNAGLSYGMECSFGHKNFISRAIDSCPGLLDSEDKSYCCFNIENDNTYCCDAQEFILKSSWFLLAVIVTVIIAFALVSCISCLCCSCCPWYRRRHRGTVYGKVQLPNLVHVIQAPANIPVPTPHYTNTTYATSSTGMSQPPTYSEVVYEKQAPYNPNYVSSMQQ